MPNRTFSTPSYRYGFNGKEMDNEVKGNGAQYDYGARLYDPRVGKWLSRDPLQVKYPELTPYHFTANNPTNFIDHDGKDTIRFVKSTVGWSGRSSGLDGGERIPGSYRTTFEITVIQSPGEDKFFYDTKFNVMDANGNPLTGNTSTEFFPNDRFSRTGITTSPRTYLPGRKDDEDFVSLAKLSSPELLAYLKIHDRMKYGGLDIVQDAYSEYEKATDYAGTALLVVGFAQGINLRGLISSGSSRNILQDILQIKRLKGNADLAAGTEAEALNIGKAWVNGDNVRTLNIKDGVGWTD